MSILRKSILIIQQRMLVNAQRNLKKIIENEHLVLNKSIPLRVHFGEKGNSTFIMPDNYNGILNYLKDLNVEPFYIETNVLYRGERTTKKGHIKLAINHGFTQIPIVIGDGNIGRTTKK